MTTGAPVSGAERLQKVLARAGFGSRRACEEMIRAGRVHVNGRIATLGSRADPDTDEISVDGVRLALSADLVYLALNKPLGVLSAAKDARGRATVADLVPQTPRVFPVGRLDRDTSGLILLTNDGEFANRVSHPRYGIPKTYVAEVRGKLAPAAVRSLRTGLRLEDGMARAERVKVRSSGQGRALVEITVAEGRNRLVRRMLEASGVQVVSLARVSIGGVRLGRLRPGGWRALRREEITELIRAGEASAP